MDKPAEKKHEKTEKDEKKAGEKAAPEMAPVRKYADNSPVKTEVPKKAEGPSQPKTVAEHNAWVDSLADPGAVSESEPSPPE